MGVLLSILGTVASICLSIGLSHTADRIERDKVAKSNANPTYLLGTLQYALDDIRAKSAQAYEEALTKLNAIPVIQASGGLLAYMRRVKSQAADDVSSKSQLASKVENSVQGFKQEVQSYNYQPDSYKNSQAGQDYLKSIQDRADDLSTQIEQKLGDN